MDRLIDGIGARYGTVNSVARRLHEACLAAEILLLPHVGADGDRSAQVLR